MSRRGNAVCLLLVATALALADAKQPALQSPAAPLSPYPDTVIATIAVGGDPTSAVSLPSGDFLYVGNETDNRVTVVRLADRTVIARISCGTAPWEVCCKPDGSAVYVSNLNSASVSVIRTADNRVIATVPVGYGPCLADVTPDGSFLYVTNSTSNTVSVIRTDNNQVIATVPVGSNPRSITCLPEGDYVYVGNRQSNDVSVIRTSDNTVVLTIPVNGGAHRLRATQDGRYVYVSLYGQNRLDVISTASNSVIGSITLPGTGVSICMLTGIPYAMVCCPNANQVAAINTADHTIVGIIQTGLAPWGITADTACRYVYTASRHSQDVTVIARRELHDASTCQVLAPRATVIAGSTITPKAVIVNRGATSETVPVTMGIGSTYHHTVTRTLLPGATDTVLFPTWTAAPVGTLPVTCFTSLAGDMSPANDTIRDSVTVVTTLPLDVAVDTILLPPARVDSGSQLAPKAVVTNLGELAAVFPVTMRIGDDYAWWVSETLAAGARDTVLFPTWTATRVGTFPIVCYTSLVGDQNRTNDTLQSAVIVETSPVIDVGITTILAPDSVVQESAIVVPKAIVRNYGTQSAAFPISFTIGSEYAAAINETLAAGGTDTVTFPVWRPATIGALALACYSALTGDQNPTNDTAAGSVRVLAMPRHDVGPDSLLWPSLVRPGDTVIPRVRIRNWGNQPERYFDVTCRIGLDYQSTRIVQTVLPAAGTVTQDFEPWIARPGTQAVTAITLLTNDNNPSNDTLVCSVPVQNQPQLQVEPNQSDRIPPGTSRTYWFWAMLAGDYGDTVELVRPSVPAGWSLALYDSTGTQPISSLGFVLPGRKTWFAATVQPPNDLGGETSGLGTIQVTIIGRLRRAPTVKDSVILALTLTPQLSVHNFPNPFCSQTTFVIGLPQPGRLSLTIHNRTGETIARLLDNEPTLAGIRRLDWQPINSLGQRLAPGTYDYVLDYRHDGITQRVRRKLVVTSE